jgi:hypothetical protein
LSSLLAADLALSAWGSFAGTEVTDAPAQGAKKMLLIRHAPALSVKLEKCLSRPDCKGHISFIETHHEVLPGGIRTRDADSERDLNESG